MSDTATGTLRTHEGREIPAAGTYDIDRSHSTVEFVGRHLMITKVRGRFADFAGRLTVGERPETSSVQVTIDTASIDTADERRDGHLRSADFFDTETYPTITFVSTKVEPGRGGRWQLAGDLTVRGVTRPVTLDVEFDGAATTPWGEERIGFTAATEVDREDWGLTWNQTLETGGVLVGRKIRIELNVQAARRA